VTEVHGDENVTEFQRMKILMNSQDEKVTAIHGMWISLNFNG